MKKIRLIVRENELIRDKDENIIAVVTNHKTRDYELNNSMSNLELIDNDKYKYEIVSAEFIN